MRRWFWLIYSVLIAAWLRARGARIGRRFRTSGRLDLLLRDGATLRNLVIGDDVSFGGRTYIRMRRRGLIRVGRGVRTGTEVWLVAANEEALTVGDETILGSYSIFNGGHGLSIGTACIFAAFVYVNTSDHGVARGELIQRQGFVGAPTTIGDDVWLGGHVFVSKGVDIGSGAVIGAGGIVVGDIESNVIAVGNPARAIREREARTPCDTAVSA